MAVSINLAGRIILVCGVLRTAIGGATARRIAAAGAQVVVVDYLQDVIDGTVADIERAGGACHGILADLREPDQCAQLVKTVIERFGRIDGVANVTGGDCDHWLPLEETPNSAWSEVLNLNLEYVFRLCRDIAVSMIERGIPGSIVNIGSVSALTSAPHHGPYGAAKAGVIALTKTMAFEWGRHGIRANTVSPGAVLTGKNGDSLASRGVTPTSNELIVWTSTDELANGVLFLLSDLASGISGQNLVIDSALSTRYCAIDRPLAIPKSPSPGGMPIP